MLAYRRENQFRHFNGRFSCDNEIKLGLIHAHCHYYKAKAKVRQKQIKQEAKLRTVNQLRSVSGNTTGNTTVSCIFQPAADILQRADLFQRHINHIMWIENSKFTNIGNGSTVHALFKNIV